VENTLTYYDMATIITVKGFIVQVTSVLRPLELLLNLLTILLGPEL